MCESGCRLSVRGSSVRSRVLGKVTVPARVRANFVTQSGAGNDPSQKRNANRFSRRRHRAVESGIEMDAMAQSRSLCEEKNAEK